VCTTADGFADAVLNREVMTELAADRLIGGFIGHQPGISLDPPT
jgi:hypothetical protein